MSQDSPSYYAIIPANVRYCKNLEPSAKLLYGEITALCSKEGYCWASNSYFSELYEVDERTIQRWLLALKTEKFIEVEITKNGFNTSRKIYIFQNNFTARQKCHSRDDKNVVVPPDKNVTHINTVINTLEKQQQPVAGSFFYHFLANIDVPQSEKVWLTENYTEETVKHAVEYSVHPTTKIKTSLIQCIKWACERKPPIPEIPADQEVFNKSYATTLHQRAQIPDGIIFEVLNQSVEVGFSYGQKGPIQLKYTEKGFKEQLENTLRKYSIKF